MLSVSGIYVSAAADFLTDVMGVVLDGSDWPSTAVDRCSVVAQWRGRGCAVVGVDGAVTDRQLENLWVDGVHPDADRLYADSYRASMQAAAVAGPVGFREQGDAARAAVQAIRLGRRWSQASGSSTWREALDAAYREYNTAAGTAAGAPISGVVREQVHRVRGAQEFRRVHGQSPTEDELAQFLHTAARAGHGTVSGYELLFTGPPAGAGGSAVAVSVAAHQAAVEFTLRPLEQLVPVHSGRAGGAVGLLMVLCAAQLIDDRPTTRVLISGKVHAHDGRWLTLDHRILETTALQLEAAYDLAAWPAGGGVNGR